MEGSVRYIKVILPLKLGWEPFYRVPSYEGEIRVGDRALAPFAGKTYLGVVSDEDAAPPEDALIRIREMFGVDRSKDCILPSEISFWRLLASYYMCTVGEVYKAAYPSVKDELVTPRRKEEAYAPDVHRVDLDQMQERLYEEVEKAFAAGKSVLLNAGGSEAVAIRECVEHSDGAVLWLVPELKQVKALKQRLEKIFGSALVVWGSNLTAARKREAARRIRSGEHCVLLGTRSAVFLPYRKISLVIVQDEQDSSYKQTSPSPRYNGRDAAVLLASSFGANVLLCSRTPSFEMLFNCLSGRYSLVTDGRGVDGNVYEIIDTRAELGKNGMVGDVSRKLIGLYGACRSNPENPGRTAVYKPRRALFPKTEDLVPQLAACLGPDVAFSEDIIGHPFEEDVSLLAIFGADSLLGRADFRSDEHCLQEILKVTLSLPSLDKVAVQTANSGHPVFNVLKSGDVTPLIEERRQYGYPPFSRIVDVIFKDTSPQRLSAMLSSLSLIINGTGGCRVIAAEDMLRLIIPRDRKLQTFKARLLSVVDAFEKEHRYTGHITFDVDPAS